MKNGVMVMSTRYRHLFGPVPSRRFGRSLGIDLTPRKTCSFDCVFCQLGRTTRHTVDRREYVPLAEVIEELDDWLEQDGQADYLTLAGSGEPTLHTGFGEVLRHLRTASDIPSVLLTNSSLLSDPEVRAGAANASVVKASLGAFDDASLQALNRPVPGIGFKELVGGLKRFRLEYSGDLRLEVFLVPGINDDPEQVSRIARLVEEIGPDRVQLNTAIRPAADPGVTALSPIRLRELAALFHPPAEIPEEFSAGSSEVGADAADRILDLLCRRPCTADQVAAVFGLHPNEVAKHLGHLLQRGATYTERRSDAVYHRADPAD